MQNLIFAKDLTNETEATEAIFNACRDNANRKPHREMRAPGFTVSFTVLADGTHEACVRNYKGVVVALAIVDEFDV